MKTWKVRTESGTIGKIKLDKYSVYVTEENITVNIDIVQMSVTIKNELMRAVEIAKKHESKELSQLSKRYGRNVYSVWSDKPVVLHTVQEIQLSIISLWVLKMRKIIA